MKRSHFKLKLSSILIIIVAITIALASHYTYFPLFQSEINIEGYIALLSLLSLLIVSIFTKFKIFRDVGSFINHYIICVLLGVFIEVIYTGICTDKTFEFAINQSYIYISIILTYAIYYLLEYAEKKFIIVLVLIPLVELIYCSYIATVYNTKGIVLNKLFITTTTWVRNGRIRIGSSPLFWLILLISFNKFLNGNKKEKFLNGLISLFIILYFIFVNQSRSLLISIVAMCGCMLIFNKEDTRVKTIIKVVLLFLISFFAFAGGLSSFFKSFTIGKEVANTTIRLSFINEISNAIDKMPLGYILGCGMGGTVTINGFQYNFIDIGFLGDFFNFGIVTLIIDIPLVIRLCKNIGILKPVEKKHYIFSVGLLGMILAGFLGFTLIQTSRFFSMPFIVALMEYYRKSAIKYST
jgi:hypothetical protein